MSEYFPHPDDVEPESAPYANTDTDTDAGAQESQQEKENFIKKAVKLLKRFFGGNEKITRQAVEEYRRKHPDVEIADVYRALSEKKGKGKPHEGLVDDSQEGEHGIKSFRGRLSRRKPPNIR